MAHHYRLKTRYIKFGDETESYQRGNVIYNMLCINTWPLADGSLRKTAWVNQKVKSNHQNRYYQTINIRWLANIAIFTGIDYGYGIYEYIHTCYVVCMVYAFVRVKCNRPFFNGHTKPVMMIKAKVLSA